jgi:hypothetical protein
MDQSKKERFKRLIKFLETSGGKNLNHETLSSGINKGETAGGAYGMVPSSAKDFIKQAQNRNFILPEGTEEILQMPANEVTEKLNKNRNLDEALADVAADVILNKTSGNEEKAAYGWRTGHNRNFKVLQDYLQHPYVKKYKELKEDEET